MKRQRGARKVGPWEPDARQLEIHGHVVRGKSYTEVAKLVGLNRSTVWRTCQKIEDWLIPQHLADIKRIKAAHVERLLYLYGEALSAWEASKADAVMRRKAAGGEKGDTVTVERRKQCGNPQFLEQARKCLEDIRNIVGANAPIHVQHSGSLRVAGQDPDKIRAEFVQRVLAVNDQ